MCGLPLASILWYLCLLQPIFLFANPILNTNLVLHPINSGFGAIFSSVLSSLNMYEQEGYGGIHIDLNSGMYLDPDQGPNYWEYFFEPIRLGKQTNASKILSLNEICALINAGFVMSRERGCDLIQKYVHVKPHIQEEVDQFVCDKFKDFFVVGVHYRGTDKKIEVPLVPYHTLWCHVNWWIANCPEGKTVRIFIATDDQHFLDYMDSLFPDQVVYNDFVRSKDGQPLHYGNDWYASNYQKGREAVIDCLLLSKCHVLLFPAASAFSMAALKFNPHQIGIPLSGH